MATIILNKPKARNPISADNWLDSLGLYRKNVAHDETCLFRAVSEHVSFCQFLKFVFIVCCFSSFSARYITKGWGKSASNMEEPIFLSFFMSLNLLMIGSTTWSCWRNTWWFVGISRWTLLVLNMSEYRMFILFTFLHTILEKFFVVFVSNLVK